MEIMKKKNINVSLLGDLSHVKFCQSKIAQGWSLLCKALLCVRDHNSLANSSQHIVHNQ